MLSLEDNFLKQFAGNTENVLLCSTYVLDNSCYSFSVHLMCYSNWLTHIVFMNAKCLPEGIFVGRLVLRHKTLKNIHFLNEL